MAVSLTINIEEGSPPPCDGFYQVFYKLEGASEYTPLYSPEPLLPPFTIAPLIAGQRYEVTVQRFCCDGSNSPVLSTYFDT